MRAVQFVERGIKRGGLAGAGRAGDQDQAVRRVNGGFELLEGVGVQAQLVDAGGEIGLSSTRSTIFSPCTVGRTETRKSIVLAADLDAHAAVLRQAAFGDVQAAHDFEARGQGQLHLLGRRRGVHQHAVNAVAQAHHLLERLQVHVAGAVFDGLDEDQVGQLDDRRLLAGGGQLVEVDLLDGFLDDFEVVGLGLGLAPAFAASWMMSSMRAALGGVNVRSVCRRWPFPRRSAGRFPAW